MLSSATPRCEVGLENWVQCNDAPVKICKYPVTGLYEGRSYIFRVRAVNSAGISRPSRVSEPVAALDPVDLERTQSRLYKIETDVKYLILFFSRFCFLSEPEEQSLFLPLIEYLTNFKVGDVVGMARSMQTIWRDLGTPSQLWLVLLSFKYRHSVITRSNVLKRDNMPRYLVSLGDASSDPMSIYVCQQ